MTTDEWLRDIADEILTGVSNDRHQRTRVVGILKERLNIETCQKCDGMHWVEGGVMEQRLCQCPPRGSISEAILDSLTPHANDADYVERSKPVPLDGFRPVDFQVHL